RLCGPSFESRFAESRVFAGDECAVVDVCAGIERVRIGDDLAMIAELLEATTHEFVEREFFGATRFDDTVDGRASRGAAYGGGNIIGGHRLEESSRQVNLFAVETEVGKLLQEFEKLRGLHDGVRNRAFLDQFFLRDFCAEVAAFCETIRADNRQ